VLAVSLQEAKSEETKLRNELKLSQSVNEGAISHMIAQKTKEKELALEQPRRMCGLSPAPQDPQVLGKIAHPAQVRDDPIARVLSWHMSADMDCVVTLTTKKVRVGLLSGPSLFSFPRLKKSTRSRLASSRFSRWIPSTERTFLIGISLCHT
jgi:hypothetical protein